MHYLIQITALVVTVMITGSLNAQQSPEELAQEFFQIYVEEGSTKALDKLYSTNKWITKAEDAITNLKTQMSGLDEEFVGKYYGYELLVKRELTESYVLLSYLVKFDRQPLRYVFQFYKPNDQWRIYSFKYDGELPDELEESAKVYFITGDHN